LIRVTATIENIGNVMIKIDHAEIRINWISPRIEDVVDSIQRAEKSRHLEIEFPQIDAKVLNLKKGEIIIVEPGELDNIYCDFILKMDDFPDKMTDVMVYCYIRDIKSRNRPLGWSFEECYNLNNKVDSGEF
jgi:hypothetical protein